MADEKTIKKKVILHNGSEEVFPTTYSNFIKYDGSEDSKTVKELLKEDFTGTETNPSETGRVPKPTETSGTTFLSDNGEWKTPSYTMIENFTNLKDGTVHAPNKIEGEEGTTFLKDDGSWGREKELSEANVGDLSLVKKTSSNENGPLFLRDDGTWGFPDTDKNGDKFEDIFVKKNTANNNVALGSSTVNYNTTGKNNIEINGKSDFPEKDNQINIGNQIKSNNDTLSITKANGDGATLAVDKIKTTGNTPTKVFSMDQNVRKTDNIEFNNYNSKVLNNCDIRDIKQSGFYTLGEGVTSIPSDNNAKGGTLIISIAGYDLNNPNAVCSASYIIIAKNGIDLWYHGEATNTESGEQTNGIINWKHFDQSLATDSDVSFNSINTGQGTTKVYPMDQDVKINSDVTFNSIHGKVYAS